MTKKTKDAMNRYFDNGSTSFPKPPAVSQAIGHYLTCCGGTYGRAAYGKVLEATKMAEQCRDRVAAILGVSDAGRVAFTANATSAINTIVHGMNLKGGRVLVSPMEHNAVMRPLYDLEQQGIIETEVLPALPDGRIDPAVFCHPPHRAVKLICCVHQSNVNGVVQPVEALCRWAGAIPVMVDATQSAGYIPVMGDGWGAEAVVFTGHKGLLGPTGTGGFYIRHPQLLHPFMQGGTGSNSEHYGMPQEMPDRFEAGTPNMAGLAGLNAALEHIPQWQITHQQWMDWIEKLRQQDGIRVYGASQAEDQGKVISFTHCTLTPSTIAFELFEKHGIEVRQGLHCAPLAHRTIGTFPTGTVRVALSPYHSMDDLTYLLMAIEQIISTGAG